MNEPLSQPSSLRLRPPQLACASPLLGLAWRPDADIPAGDLSVVATAVLVPCLHCPPHTSPLHCSPTDVDISADISAE